MSENLKRRGIKGAEDFIMQPRMERETHVCLVSVSDIERPCYTWEGGEGGDGRAQGVRAEQRGDLGCAISLEAFMCECMRACAGRGVCLCVRARACVYQIRGRSGWTQAQRQTCLPSRV
jgi:hypothetical protein